MTALPRPAEPRRGREPEEPAATASGPPLDLRLVPVAAGSWAGVLIGGPVLGLHAPTVTGPAAVGAVCGLAVAVVAAWRRPAPATRLVLALFVAAVVAGFGAHLHHDRTTADLAALDARAARVTVTGTLAEEAAPVPGAFAPGTVTVPLDVTVLDARGRTGTAHGTVHVTGPAAHLASLPRGAEITVTGVLDGDAATPPFLDLARVDASGTAPPTWRHRASTGMVAASAGLDADTAALLRGMTSGDTSGMSPQFEEDMRVAGLAHLVAVSGSNCAIVVGTVFLALRPLRVPRRIAVGAATAVLAGYVAYVGPEPTILRAGLMAAVALGALALGSSRAALPILATSVLALSLTAPGLVATWSFALSVAATAGILILTDPLSARLTALTRGRVPRPVIVAVAVAFAAQVSCTPLLLFLQPYLATWSVPANLLAAPLVGPATVLGLGAAVLVLLGAPGTATIVAELGGFPAHAIAAIGRTAAGAPGAAVPWPGGIVGAALFCAMALAAVLLARGLRRPLVRRAAACAAALAAGAGLGSALTPAPAGTWLIAACDVGQGDAVLLRSPPRSGSDGHTVLIDTGPDPAALDACLDRLGIDRLDDVILTHPHADHDGAVAALTGRDVGALTRCPAPAGEWSGPLPEGVPVTTAVTGHQGGGDGLFWQVLWPGSAEDVEQVAAREDSGEENARANDCSLVVAATWEGAPLTFIGLGDLEPAAQKELARRLPATPAIGAATTGAATTGAAGAGDAGTADAGNSGTHGSGRGGGGATVVKVAHHGSARQHAGLYAQLDADLALLTVGAGNDHGHPRSVTLDMLTGLGAHVARTDTDGLILVSADATSLRIH